MTVDSALTRYHFLIAHVINNSINRSHNYITIEKRTDADGVEPEMGVIDQNGIVGIVNVVTDHTARLISVLNPYLASLLQNQRRGSGRLTWRGTVATRVRRYSKSSRSMRNSSRATLWSRAATPLCFPRESP